MERSAWRTSSTRIRVSHRFALRFINLTIIPPRSHPTEPQCSYDPVEGLPLAPDADPFEKIRELEEQVGALLYSRACSIDLIRISDSHEKNEITARKHITISFQIAQSPSTTFQPSHKLFSFISLRYTLPRTRTFRYCNAQPVVRDSECCALK